MKLKTLLSRQGSIMTRWHQLGPGGTLLFQGSCQIQRSSPSYQYSFLPAFKPVWPFSLEYRESNWVSTTQNSHEGGNNE